ncbi:MAG: hypothetical protein ACK47Y_11430, partial [Dolichospermum sp.]
KLRYQTLDLSMSSRYRQNPPLIIKTLGLIPGINPQSKIQNPINHDQNSRIYPRTQSKIQNPKADYQ